MAAPDRIKVGAAQYPLDWVPDLEAWRGKVSRWVADGAATGADLLVFPEYGAIELAAARGSAVAGSLEASLAAVVDSVLSLEAHFSELARRHRVHILAPSGPDRGGAGRYVNAARLVTPTGGIGVQQKLIMTPFEQRWGIAPGEPLRVFETALGRLGIAICYDAEFPLIVRAQAEAGAEVVLIPSCTEQSSGYARVRAAAQARALESQIATVVSPTVGEAPWSPAVDRNTGRAGIYLPPDPALVMSGVLAEGELDRPGWVVAEVDLAALRRVRLSGETRNAADWRAQPSAAPLTGQVEVSKLA
jgi:predicted amidohydrolase